jgi:hypothetical protein
VLSIVVLGDCAPDGQLTIRIFVSLESLGSRSRLVKPRIASRSFSLELLSAEVDFLAVNGISERVAKIARSPARVL